MVRGNFTGVDLAPGRLAGSAAPDVKPEPLARNPSPSSLAVELVILATIMLTARLLYLDHAPYVDELNHALAARSLLEDGTLSINGGVPYTRAWLFTYLVAAFKAVFGQSLVVGRIPAVLAGLGLVLAMFVWVRSIAGRWAGWTAALLLGFAPVSIYLSQQVRFYTLHAILFWGAAIAVYAAVEMGTGLGRRRAGLLAGAMLAFALAYHLQPVTLVGVGALWLWVALDRAPAFSRWFRAVGRPTLLAVIGAVAVVFFLLALGGSDLIADRLRFFGYADLWAAGKVDRPLYYHWHFVDQYPTLWTLFPFAVLIAASRFGRPTLFLGMIFAGAFVIHSAAAWKHERYLYYTLPFFFAIWGLAAAVIIPWLRERLDAVLEGQPGMRPLAAAGSVMFALILGASLLFAAAGNTAALYTYRMLTVSDVDWRMERAYRGEADWEGAMSTLRPLADSADVVVASAMLKSLYYLGRVDFGLSLGELRGAQEFAVARKEAVPVISRPESLGLVRSCFRSGLVIADDRSYRRPWGVTDEAADYLETSMEAVAFPAGSGLVVFRWTHPLPYEETRCPSIPGRSADRMLR
jgi:4-amino-4-deoxy-L-arabinose transferase-like glycosyltransferase